MGGNTIVVDENEETSLLLKRDFATVKVVINGRGEIGENMCILQSLKKRREHFKAIFER